ncbi:MAG: DUF2399 domain-containing protein [Anaerolineae bacterium]|nr:DUF2399 domain-containing protein [Anaerolineae bacterium]
MTPPHSCIWRTITEWRSEPEAGRWVIQCEYKVRRCTECGQEKWSRPTARRRRYREKLPQSIPSPTTLEGILTPSRFKSVAQVMAATERNRLDIEAQIQEWLDLGWAEVEETQHSATRAWQVQKLRLSPAAEERLIHTPQAMREQHQQQALLDALAHLKGWREDLCTAKRYQADDPELTTLLGRLESVLDDQEQSLQNGMWVSLPGTQQRPGDAPHQRWLRVLRGLLALLTTDYWEYERTFSARWLGDSKQLGRERQELEAYLDISFEQIGLFRHTPLAYCWGPFQATYAKYTLDGRAGNPFIALTVETIRALREIRVAAQAILVVENQTAFETLLRPPLCRDDVLYLFSSGHAGYAERALLHAWLTATPNLPWYIWTDWDVGGVRIQQDWAKWADNHHLAAPVAWMWDQATLIRWGAWGHPLTDEQRTQLLGLSHPLASSLLQAGYTLEQETVLPELSTVELEGLFV